MRPGRYSRSAGGSLQRWRGVLQLPGCYREVPVWQTQTQQNSDFESESENDEALVSEREGLEEVDELAFGKLMAGAVEQCVVMLMAKLTFKFAGKQAEVPAPTSTKI